ncbi:SPOR domain-containing protein [Marinobacter sp. 1Y8]
MDGLKQRIVGALVLVSLAVIFVPMLFDEPHTERQSRVIDLPEEPAFPSMDNAASSESPEPDAASGQMPEPDQQAPAYTLEEGNSEAGGVEPAPAISEPAPETAPAVATPEPSPAPAVESEPEPAPEKDPQYSKVLKGAWLVQLGSFGNADNAKRLRDKVREQGFDAYIQAVDREGASLSRVFSGPFASEDDARSAKTKLDKSFSLNSLVTSGGK